MFHIAILDDEQRVIDEMKDYLADYSVQTGESLGIAEYTDPLKFLDEFSRSRYDIIFLDIEMPDRNGMETARKIRELDEDVILVFVTNMAQYAIRGYEVDAYRFLVKPIGFHDFSTLMAQIVTKLRKMPKGETITITSAGSIEKLFVRDILYVDIYGHKATYHLGNREFATWESMKVIASKLEPYDFALCNSCFLVNLRYVKAIRDLDLTLVNGTVLAISHGKKREILQKLSDFLGR